VAARRGRETKTSQRAPHSLAWRRSLALAGEAAELLLDAIATAGSDREALIEARGQRRRALINGVASTFAALAEGASAGPVIPPARRGLIYERRARPAETRMTEVRRCV
jgi:hypothetical protein